MALRRLRFTAAEIARGARDGALDRLGDPASSRHGQARCGSGSSSRCATSERALASSCTSTSRSSAGSRAELAGASAEEPQHYNRHLHGPRRPPPQHGRLRVRAHRRRRLQPARLRRGARRREGDDRSRLPAPCGRLLPASRRSASSACPQRQRILLPLDDPRPRLSQRSASATFGRARTGRRRTGRQSASSAPSCTAGRTERSTPRAASAPPHLTAGSGTTTIAGDTQRSAANPRSRGPTCLGLTRRGRGVTLVDVIDEVAQAVPRQGRRDLAAPTGASILRMSAGSRHVPRAASHQGPDCSGARSTRPQNRNHSEADVLGGGTQHVIKRRQP